MFDGPLIGRNDDVNWPPRSCQLTPFDYFLWGAVKEKCYANKPEASKHFKVNIRNVIAKIRPHTLENVHENCFDLLRYCEYSEEQFVLHNKSINLAKFQIVFVLNC